MTGRYVASGVEAEADPLSVRLLAGQGDDAELVEQVTALLQEELLELDVAAVEPPQGEAPEAAKGPFADIAGWLLVFLGSAGLEPVINTVAAWATRNKRSVELSYDGDTLKLDGATKAQVDKALDEWFARHPAGT